MLTHLRETRQSKATVPPKWEQGTVWLVIEGEELIGEGTDRRETADETEKLLLTPTDVLMDGTAPHTALAANTWRRLNGKER